MALTLVATRYNWMGYHGTESEEAALLRWAGKQEGNFDYNNRKEILDEIEQRLFLIKLEHGLLSPEEIAEMERRRREQEREEAERRERERLLREERFAAERRVLEEEETMARAQLEHDLRFEINEMEKELERFLRAGLKLRSEVSGSNDRGYALFNQAVRSFLVSNDTGFVSYLDGSYHTNLASLDKHNASKRSEIAAALEGTRIALPKEQQFDTQKLHDLVDIKDMLRMKLDAFKCKDDENFVERLRMKERQDPRTPRMPVGNDETERSLSSQLDHAIEELKKARNSYNTTAAAAAHPINVAIASRDRPFTARHEEKQ